MPASSLTAYLPDAFFAKLMAIGRRQNFDPEDALSVMFRESGVKPTSLHPSASASGIFGKMFKTRAEAEAFATESAESQLDAYERFMSPYRNVPKPRAVTLYQLNFLPASANPGSHSYRGIDDDAVLAARGGSGYGGSEDGFYRSNTGIDMNHDGVITVADLDGFLQSAKKQQPQKWAELQTRLRESGYTRPATLSKLGPLIALLGLIGGAVYYATRRA